MTGISGLSSGLMRSYINFQSKEKISSRELFQMLSLELGGDSEKITKKQLDSYLEEAEDGLLEVSTGELSSLKTLQRNWDTISSGKDSITFSDMENYSGLLISMVIGSGQENSEQEKDYSMYDYQENVDNYIIAHTLGIPDLADASESDLSSYLKELLSGSDSSDDDSNANLIDTLTNMIAMFSSKSTLSLDV